uniref:DUF6535 domain-containing protein n=1 Tax=Psilocybe cubensis TaxID=181762 RepID=A0A8H7XMR4_PSICU
MKVHGSPPRKSRYFKTIIALLQSANVKQNQPNTGSYSDLPGNKLWDVQDPFKYSPPKPEGDLWTLLLDPLIKKDKAQCEAWKDEVHNLLIFAGLFSAVVTAFIVESYKNLQADPSDTIVALLSQIALQTSRAPNATAVKLEPADSFVPTQSSIRVNVFWFLSLVLSLATVVVGIVSLQWLREHQSYESDLSPQEKYALFNMRADGLKAWHVDKIFTSLPLLLQSALVLFLGGIVDFLHAIGYWAVTVPVMVAISFVLMFLIATTLLPCLQVIYLSTCIPFITRQTSKRIDPPSQCPYKSPQSQAIRRIFTFLHRTNTLYHLRKFFLIAKRLLKHILAGYPGRFKLGYGYNNTVTECLRMAFQTQWWTHFDVAWLSIRDAYMRRSFERELYFLRPEDQEVLPIHDAVAGLLLQRDQKSTAHLAYHCFDKISLMSVPRFCYYQETYLHSLLTNALGLAGDTSLSDFLCLPDTSSPPDPIYLSILRQQNLLLFIGGHTSPEGVPSYAAHKFELYIRLVKYFHEENKHHRAEIGDQKISWCLTIRQDFRYIVSRNMDPEAFIGKLIRI